MGTNAMNFEEVVRSLLFNKPNALNDYYASIYTDDILAVRALLYSTCIKERDFNAINYTTEEKAALDKFIENLLQERDLQNGALIIDCINLLVSKI